MTLLQIRRMGAGTRGLRCYDKTRISPEWQTGLFAPDRCLDGARIPLKPSRHIRI